MEKFAAGAFWALPVLYGSARVLQVFPAHVPMLAIVALHVLPPAIFALIHGSLCYGKPAGLAFPLISLSNAGIFELASLRTGFPFGHYYFTAVMGPKIAGLPLLLALAYVGMAYLAWTLSRLILGVQNRGNVPNRSHLITLPLLSAFLLVAWDFSMEPVWATIVRAWIWTEGGPYFGVPFSNFLGWFLTVYVFYQVFALYLARQRVEPRAIPPLYWRQAVLFYAASAAGNLLFLIPNSGPAVVVEAAGTKWAVHSITTATSLVSLFGMGAFAFVAWVRLNDREAGA